MKNSLLCIKKLFLIFFLLIIFYNSIFAFKRVKEKEAAPDFTLNDVSTGKQIKLLEYKGQKNVSLIFWKYPSLRGEKALAFYQKLYDKYSIDFPYQVIAVYVPQYDDKVTDEELTAVSQIIKNNYITFPVLIDKGMEVFNRYGVITFPTSAIIDKDGILVYELPGLPEFFGEKDITQNVKKAIGVKEEEKVIAKVTYKSKNNADYYLNLAKQVHKKGNTSKAIEHTLTAISRDSDYADAHSYLGFLYAKEKNYTKAIEAYLQSLKLDSSNNMTLLAYGFLCLEAGMNEDAFLQFRNIIQVNPEKSAEGHYGLGAIYLHDGIFDSARVHQEQAIQLYSAWKSFSEEERIHFALAYYNLGETFLKIEKKTEASMNFQKSFEKYKEFTDEIVKKNKIRAGL